MRYSYRTRKVRGVQHSLRALSHLQRAQRPGPYIARPLIPTISFVAHPFRYAEVVPTMKRCFLAALAASFVLCVAGSSSFAAAPHVDREQITMNFHQVDIPVLAKFISELTGKNFIIDESVRGKVDIISPTKVTPEEAYAMFQSALQIKGFTTQ